METTAKISGKRRYLRRSRRSARDISVRAALSEDSDDNTYNAVRHSIGRKARVLDFLAEVGDFDLREEAHEHYGSDVDRDERGEGWVESAYRLTYRQQLLPSGR